MSGLIFHHGLSDREKELYYRKEIKRLDDQIKILSKANQNLKKTVSHLFDSLDFVVTARKIINNPPCKYLDRMDFPDAELILPKLDIPEPNKSIFYQWLSGWTYQEIGEKLNISRERVRQRLMKVVRKYRVNKDNILESIKIGQFLDQVTFDYRNRREQIIDQIKVVLR